MPGVSEHFEHADSDELAQFGYKQELDRSPGQLLQLRRRVQLHLDPHRRLRAVRRSASGSAGPAFFWTWPIVFIGQLLVALCFAELAGQYPLAGSVYQWSKQIATALTSWMAGWILLIGSIVTVAAVAVAYQVILPQISTAFEFVGTPADAGLYYTPGGAKNAVILGVGLVRLHHDREHASASS